MTLPTSGLLRATDINVELGRASNTTMRLGEDKVRGLARKPNGKVAYSDMHGKEAPTGIVAPYPPNITTYNLNMAAYARNNGWDGVSPIDFQLIIPASTNIGSTSSTAPAIETGVWPAGSNLTLVVNGQVLGCGGTGGAHGYEARGQTGNGAAGAAGGNAINMSYPLTIVNNGNIFAGGGGGGGGGTNSYSDTDYSYTDPGGGSGGGQGLNGGAAGYVTHWSYAGSAGSINGPGSGARPRGISPGGNGGAWGSAGGAGTSGNTGRGGAGGAGGRSVNRNGNVLIWQGTNGNNSTNVRGVVA